MVKTYALLTLAQPQNLVATAVAGGALVNGTTYYYKIFACRNDTGAVTSSPRSAVASATCDAVNKSIQLDWNAIAGYTPSATRYNCYYILRNTTNDFTDGTGILLCSAANAPYFVATNTFTNTVVGVVQSTPNWVDGLPTILVGGGTAADPVLAYDIWQADIAAGWGRFKLAADTTAIEYGVNKKQGGFYYCHANIKFGFDVNNATTTTYFWHKNGGIILFGSSYVTTVCTFTFGTLMNTYDANPDQYGFFAVHGSVIQESAMAFNGIMKLYGMKLIKGGMNWPATISTFYDWAQPYSIPGLTLVTDSVVYDCDFPAKGNGYNVNGTGAMKSCRFGGLSPYSTTVTIEKPKVVSAEGLGLRNAGGLTIIEPTTTYTSHDIMWHTALTQIIVDGTFLSHSQTDNIPWLYLGYASGGMGTAGSLTFKSTLGMTIQDTTGQPISGASVVVVNAVGTTVATGTTDASGVYNPGILTAKILVPLISKTGYEGYSPKSENTMVTDGVLRRDMYTPHTVTISKSGYKTKTIKYTINKKMTEVETLEKQIPIYNVINGDGVKQVLNAYPTSPQNSVLLDVIDES